MLVCGGRDYRERVHLEIVLRGQWHRFLNHDGLILIVGYDPWSKKFQGADQLAYEWAKAVGVPVMTFPAPWGLLGPSAGPARNRRMLEDAQPEMVLTFPGGRGTAHMAKIAEDAGVEVVAC